VTLPFGSGEVEAVLFDLDDVLVPFHTPNAWQWAWKPQGPLLGERRVKAAVRRSLKAWDHRRWEGLTGRAPPADLEALHQHLTETLWAVAGHPLPDEETQAVVRRFLKPAHEIERYPDVPPLLERLRAANVLVAVATPLPLESARWLLHRAGLPDTIVRVAGDPPGPVVPDRKAFRAAAELLGLKPERIAYVGDLFWSDVRAAGRAGHPTVLLDRRDAWPKVQSGRIMNLDTFESALAAGEAAASEEPETDA
jgi:putative hydrolase of the HAD superfamily